MLLRPGRIYATKKHLLRDAHLVQQFNCQPQFQYGNPPDSIPLWVAAREDNTLSSRLTRPSHFPSVSFYYFTYIVIWPGSYQDCQIKKTPFQVSLFIWQLPILPGRFQPSTFGVCELNFRVRHGNGCILTAIATISEGCSFKTI